LVDGLRYGDRRNETIARLATAWSTRVYGSGVVGDTFCRFKESRRFAGCGRLRRDARRPSLPATPSEVYTALPSQLPLSSLALLSSTDAATLRSPCVSGTERRVVASRRVASRRVTRRQTAAMEFAVITRERNFVSNVNAFDSRVLPIHRTNREEWRPIRYSLP